MHVLDLNRMLPYHGHLTATFSGFMRLNRDFYERSTLVVARELLGKYLVFGEKVGQIVETEAYLGPEDLASHARFKSRKRNYLMYETAGIAYVYFTFGMHYMLNVTTEKNAPGAVLIRALKAVQGIDGKTDGPGNLTKALGITKAENGKDLTQPNFCIEDRNYSLGIITESSRIGIDYAGIYKDKPWRFEIK